MTDLQLKLMEWADKTLSFGCKIISKADLWLTITEVDNGIVYFMEISKRYTVEEILQSKMIKIIWHPYWWERLNYLYMIQNNKISRESVRLFDKIYMSCLDKNKELILKPCIDRPEEWQRFVLEFLESLPK